MEDETRPDLIGRYEIEEELGRGGMATVYTACDPLFERDVAVKVLPQTMLHDPKFRKRFEREGKMIARLEHNAIVPVYDFGEHDGQPYIVMRLMTGGDLSERIKSGSLVREDIGGILKRLAEGLDVAHNNGVIHRDLKPGNILFDNYGDAYISDFGIAKLQESEATLTGSAIIGTPAYMSPEQIKGEKNLDGRSDIYSLGVILYQMLSGEMPYSADTPGKIMMQHLLDPVPDISIRNPDISPAVSSVITKTLAKEPENRYQTGKQMAEAYEAAIRDEMTQADIATIKDLNLEAESAAVAAASKFVDPSIPTNKTRVSDEGLVVREDQEVSQTDIAVAETEMRIESDEPVDVSEMRIEDGSVALPTSMESDRAMDSGDSSLTATEDAQVTGMAAASPAATPVDPISQTSESVQKTKGSALKWALPAVAVVILLAVAGFFAFSGRSNNASAVVGGAVETPLKGYAVQADSLATSESIAATELAVIPTSTSLPPTAITEISEDNNESPDSIASTQDTKETTAESSATTGDEISEKELATFMQAANILAYEDMVGSSYNLPYVNETLKGMELNYKWDGNAKGRIMSDLADGPEGGGAWDLAVIAQENRDISSGELFDSIKATLDAGSSVVLEAWHLDHTVRDSLTELLNVCGVDVNEYQPERFSDLDLILYPIIGASDAVLSNPNSSLSFTNPDTLWIESGDLGDLMSLNGSGDANLLIGRDASQANQGVLVTCLDGRLTLMTFSSHSFPYETMAPLWENMITNGLKARALYLKNH